VETIQPVVEVTYAVPIDNELLYKIVSMDNQLRLSDRVVLMTKHSWLKYRDHLQPHTAKDISW